MLAYILALAVGIGSLAIYMAAFFFPEVHRKSDFIWSGVGLFWALVLWVCAGRITGGVLLGQTAGVALLGWFGWQTLTLRRQLIPVGQQTPIPSTEKLQEQFSNLSPPGAVSQLPERLTNLFTNAIGRIQSTLGAIAQRKGKPAAAVPQQPATPKTPTPQTAPQAEARGIVTEVIEIIPPPSVSESAPGNDPPELIRPNPPAPEIVAAAIEDAEAKDVPASPPETEPSKTQDKPSTSAE